MGRWVGQKMAKKSDILYGWPLKQNTALIFHKINFCQDGIKKYSGVPNSRVVPIKHVGWTTKAK